MGSTIPPIHTRPLTPSTGVFAISAGSRLGLQPGNRHLPPGNSGSGALKRKHFTWIGSGIQDNRTPFLGSPYPTWQEASSWAARTTRDLRSAAHNKLRYLLPKKGIKTRKMPKKHYLVIHSSLNTDLQHTDNRTLEPIFSLLFMSPDKPPHGTSHKVLLQQTNNMVSKTTKPAVSK